VVWAQSEFLWLSGKQHREKEGVSLVKWQAVVKPKDLGGWGLKNIHLCGKTLAAKRV
jgi:hypothetical protein